MAAGAVVGFVVGVADALDFFSAPWAGLTIAAVDGHFLSKRGNFFGEGGLRFSAEAIDPESEGAAGGSVKCFPFLRVHFLRESDGGEFCGVQDFVGVGIAYPAEEAWIGEGALEGAIFVGECFAKGIEIAGEDFDSAGIDRTETVFASEDMQGSAVLDAGFGENEGAVGKIECGEIAAG